MRAAQLELPKIHRRKVNRTRKEDLNEFNFPNFLAKPSTMFKPLNPWIRESFAVRKRRFAILVAQRL